MRKPAPSSEEIHDEALCIRPGEMKEVTMQLDRIDEIAAKAFEGYVVRKDLVRKLSRQYPVPTYVVEFLLGRYCASIDPEEIEEGLKLVQEQLGNRTVRAGEEELFKARARDKGSVLNLPAILVYLGRFPAVEGLAVTERCEAGLHVTRQQRGSYGRERGERQSIEKISIHKLGH